MGKFRITESAVRVLTCGMKKQTKGERDMHRTTDTAVTIMRSQLKDSRSRTRLDYAFYKVCQLAYYGALVGVGYLLFVFALPALGNLIRSVLP